jgi:hypothetical protein
MKLGIGELRGVIHGHKHIQLAVFRLHLGNVDMEVTNRVSGELLFLPLSPSTSGCRLMPCRCKQRCREERVKCGTLGCKAYRQSSSGSSMYLRKATIVASSSSVRTVERTSFGPVVGKAPLLPLGDGLRVDPVAFSQLVQALLTMLQCWRGLHQNVGLNRSPSRSFVHWSFVPLLPPSPFRRRLPATEPHPLRPVGASQNEPQRVLTGATHQG